MTILSMNLPTAFLALCVLALALFLTRSLARGRKENSGACGSCSGCGHCRFGPEKK